MCIDAITIVIIWLQYFRKEEQMSTTTFKELDLNPEILRAIDDAGFENMTPIQAQAIPVIFSGADILAQSQTGTGKTIAFGIPAVQSIEKGVKNVQVMVLSPTRELAEQCGEEIRKLAKYLPHVKTADIFGGANYDKQFKELKSANFIIGTPGRIMDHMRRGTLKLNKLKMIVLDEADEMLNMGFKEDIEEILKDVPEERQVVLFSATISKGIKAITKEFLKKPVNVEINRDKVTLESITQSYIHVPMYHKQDVLNLIMHRYKPKRAIVFSNTKSMVDEISDALISAGFSADGLHGDMKQGQRSKVMNAFKRGKTNILVATDVAARGIDVSDIDYVINFDIPKMSEYYVHRIGRTGRAGKDGNAITLCCGNRQISELKRLSDTVKSKISQMEIPSLKEIQNNNRDANLDLLRTMLEKEAEAENFEMLEILTEEGYEVNKIAATLMAMNFSAPIEGLIEVKAPKTKKPERSEKVKRDKDGNVNYAQIVISCGKSRRVAANHIVGAVTEKTGMSSKDIGKIIVGDEYSVVDIPVEIVDEIIVSMQGCKICGKPVTTNLYMEEMFDKPIKSDRHKRSKGHDDKKHHGDRKHYADRDRKRSRNSLDDSNRNKRHSKDDKHSGHSRNRKKK